jgi:hypothetical protein
VFSLLLFFRSSRQSRHDTKQRCNQSSPSAFGRHCNYVVVGWSTVGQAVIDCRLGSRIRPCYFTSPEPLFLAVGKLTRHVRCCTSLIPIFREVLVLADLAVLLLFPAGRLLQLALLMLLSFFVFWSVAGLTLYWVTFVSSHWKLAN